MENLKKLEEITHPDRRSNSFVICNQQTGRYREYRLEDLYREVKSIELNESVPDDVRSQFNVARNIALYTWFCYSFHNVADMKTFSTLEMALRIRLGKTESREGLKKLIQHVVNAGLIKDKHFSHIKEQLTDLESTSYIEQLPKFISHFRNDAAHGSTTLYNGAVMNLRICADFINQLFHSSI